MKSRATTHGGPTRDTLRQDRRNLLAELSDLRAQRIRKALQKAAKRLNNKRLRGKLKVEIVPEADRTPLMTFLLGCRLDGVGEKRLAFIEDAGDDCSPLSPGPDRFRSGSADVQSSIGASRRWWPTHSAQAPVVSTPHGAGGLELEHRVDIFLNVARRPSRCAVFRPLSKLSTGQQCTAILHMLLLENVDPLLMRSAGGQP
jgi:hypothetical protein